MSFVEYAIHRWVMHYGYFSKYNSYIKDAYINHAKLHHRKFYKIFDHEEDPVGRQTSIRLDLLTAVLGGAMICAIAWTLVPIFGVAFFIVIVCHHIVWNILHEEMHNPTNKFFSNWRIYKYLREYHRLHHIYPGKNYNAVFPPLADYCFNTIAPVKER